MRRLCGVLLCGKVLVRTGSPRLLRSIQAADNTNMHTYFTFFRGIASAALLLVLLVLLGCGSDKPELPWRQVELAEAKLLVNFPCEPQVGRAQVDFGMEGGPVEVSMMGCDAVDSTYAVSDWVLADASQADDALAFWQAAVLSKLKAVDGKSSKSGAPFVPPGAMPLSRSIQATVEGEGPSGWTITTHGVWFARQEGEQARIIHAVIYAPKPNHEIAQQFFQGLVLE